MNYARAYVEYNGLQDGKRLREEITIRIVSPRGLSIHELDRLDEQEIMTIDVNLTKTRCDARANACVFQMMA